MEWMIFVIPIVAIVMGIGVVFVAIWTEHKRDMALIEKGLYEPSKPANRWQTTLIWGLILTLVGLAVIISSTRLDEGLLLPGLVMEAVGVALLVYTFIIKREKPAE